MTRRPKKSPGDEKPAEQTEVRFYRANEKPYGVFSNLYLRAIEFEGETFPSAEHAYQAGKPAKQAVKKWLLSAPNPALVAMAAHGLYTWDVVPNWASTKFDRMKGVLLAKYRQHGDLRDLLLGTCDMRLVESGTTNNPVNRLWGEVNGKGENMLGKLLMEVRAELRAEAVAQEKMNAVHLSKPSKRRTAKSATTKKQRP
jgi:ribA/ribD-fused uncharacterized protein